MCHLNKIVSFRIYFYLRYGWVKTSDRISYHTLIFPFYINIGLGRYRSLGLRTFLCVISGICCTVLPRRWGMLVSLPGTPSRALSWQTDISSRWEPLWVLLEWTVTTAVALDQLPPQLCCPTLPATCCSGIRLTFLSTEFTSSYFQCLQQLSKTCFYHLSGKTEGAVHEFPALLSWVKSPTINLWQAGADIY